MKHNLISSLIAVVLISMLLPGCALIFSPSRESVNVSCATPGATLHFDGDSVGTDKARIKFNKYHVYNIVTAEKEGYKSRNYCVTLDRYAPTIAFIMVDALAIVVPTFMIKRNDMLDPSVELGDDLLIIPGVILASVISTDLRHVKTHRYEKNPIIPALIPYDLRKSDEKYLLVDSTNIDVAARDQTEAIYSRFSKYEDERPTTKKAKSYTNSRLTVNNTIFDRSLNYTLHKMRFIDTVNNVFPNFNNTLYLNATVRKIKFHEIKSPYGNSSNLTGGGPEHMPNHLFAIELAIDWDVMDFYKQKLTTLRTVEKSDLFTISYNANKDDLVYELYNALRDNMDLSIMSVRRKLTNRGLLKITDKQEVVETIEIPVPSADIRQKNEFSKSCVKITIGDNTGTGAIISADGYIVTSYHLVAGNKAVKVTFDDSTSAEATIVRRSENCDMALLKTEKSGLTPLLLSDNTDPEIGMDVWAVGANTAAGSGFNLSRGIISGVRRNNSLIMLQTDVSLNYGNTGSPLIDDKGAAVGIVSFKIVQHGVEGLGFALSGHDVLKQLGLKYRQQ